MLFRSFGLVPICYCIYLVVLLYYMGTDDYSYNQVLIEWKDGNILHASAMHCCATHGLNACLHYILNHGACSPCFMLEDDFQMRQRAWGEPVGSATSQLTCLPPLSLKAGSSGSTGYTTGPQLSAASSFLCLLLSFPN